MEQGDLRTEAFGDCRGGVRRVRRARREVYRQQNRRYGEHVGIGPFEAGFRALFLSGFLGIVQCNRLADSCKMP